MPIFGVILAFTLLALLGPPGHAQPELDAAAEELREEIGAPGVSLAVIDAAGRLETAAAGFADRDARTLFRPETLSFTGSIGKTYAATVAQLLMNDGVIDPNAPISRYVGGEDWFDGLPHAESVTLAQLLNHSAGLADYPDLLSFQASFAWRRWTGRATNYAPAELIRFAARVQPSGSPGAHFSYSDTNYLAAGLVIEAASGRAYYDLLQARVLDPLGLQDTRPAVGRDIAGLATGYVSPTLANQLARIAGPTIRNGRLRFDPSLEWTGGGLVATAADIARFYRALFVDRSLGDAVAAGLLSDLNPAEGPGLYYGRGIYVQMKDGQPAILFHGGTFPGYKVGVVLVLETNYVLAMQANTDKDFSAYRLLRDLHDRLAPAQGR
ncbi:MAG: serine hydrolase domain-containing protein [Parvularculaceae bacterium]